MAFLDLFKPKWKHSNPKIRKRALAKTSNPDKLADIALHSIHADARNKAIKKITNEKLLIYLFEKEKDKDVQITLVKKIDNPDFLVELSIKTEISDVRIIAIEKLIEKTDLANKLNVTINDSIVQEDVANEIKDETIRTELLERLKNGREKKYYFIRILPKVPANELGVSNKVIPIPIIQNINGQIAMCIFTDISKAFVFKSNFLEYASEQVKEINIEAIDLFIIRSFWPTLFKNMLAKSLTLVAINPMNNFGDFHCYEISSIEHFGL